jgi:hypothetical protein
VAANGDFLGLTPRGAYLAPSSTRPPFTAEEYEAGLVPKDRSMVDRAFDDLRGVRRQHGGPVPADDLHRRRRLDVVFGLFLASGVTVGAVCLWAIWDWVDPQGEGAFGLLYLGVFSFVPTLLAWVAGGAHMFTASRDRDVRLGVVLITAHLVCWFLVIGIELLRDDPSWNWAMRTAAILEPSLFGVGTTALAVRWFWWRRRRLSAHSLFHLHRSAR